MDRQQIGLKLALDALGQDLNLSEFNQRLMLKNTIYLVQAAKVDLGYSFRYLSGPYSPGLTRDAFALKAELTQSTDELKDWSLDPVSLQRLARLREVIQAVPDKERLRYLELLASVHFLLRTRQADIGNITGMRDVLIRNDKDFSESEIRCAIEELKRHDLCPPAEPR